MKKNYIIADLTLHDCVQFVTKAKFENIKTDDGLYYCPTFSPVIKNAKKMTKVQATKLLKEMKAEVLRAFNEKKTTYKILQIME